MADRRMFAKTIIDSDAFLDMPLSAQALYFHLSMRADDDGFINNPKKIQRMIGSSDDDFKILVAKSFVLLFESGVIVIKHWRINNYIRNDRYKETVYTEEKSFLTVKDNGSYTLGVPSDNQVVATLDTEVRLGKDRLGKDNIYPSSFVTFWECYPKKTDKGQAYKCYKARLNDGWSEEELLIACQNYAAECKKDKRETRYIKNGSTFLSSTTPFTDYLKKGGSDIGRVTGDTRSDEERIAEEQVRRIESGEEEDERPFADMPKVSG